MNAGSDPLQIPSPADPESCAWRLAAPASGSARRSRRSQGACPMPSQKVRPEPDVETLACVPPCAAVQTAATHVVWGAYGDKPAVSRSCPFRCHNDFMELICNIKWQP